MDARMMQPIAQEIARILGATASQAEGFDLEANFTMPDGTQFFMRHNRHEGKFRIHGVLNGLRKYVPYQAKTPDIGVSQDKTAGQIARDIQRRLLPDLASLTATCRARQAEHEADIKKARDAAQSICDASDGVIEILNHRNGDESAVDLYANIGSVLYLKGTAYAESINIELHGISRDLAIKVARVVRECAQ